mmetsp:Transcript_23375/g.53935  ORF Transcript_23375/g.53935 Transcript_23375/m.53935 type:complete len:550 (+) Transcript_23375:96-1745(+)
MPMMRQTRQRCRLHIILCTVCGLVLAREPHLKLASLPFLARDKEILEYEDVVDHREIVDVVGASAAESLLMGIFVVICFVELHRAKMDQNGQLRDGVMMRGTSTSAFGPLLGSQNSANSLRRSLSKTPTAKLPSPWIPTAQEIARYEDLFESMDSDADGFVEGVHAKEIMEKSALPEHDLLEIWALADSDQDGRLSRIEFACAMHFMTARRKGLILPPGLPEELLSALQSSASPAVAVAEDVECDKLRLSSARSESELGADISFKAQTFKRTSSSSIGYDEDGAGSMYGIDAMTDVPRTGEEWSVAPLIMVMVLLHAIYPSFPLSPQVEWGRIVTQLGFLFLLGPKRCVSVVKTESVSWLTFPLWSILCFVMHLVVLALTDTLAKLIFPAAKRRVSLLLLQGQQHLSELVQFVLMSNPKVSLDKDWVSAYVDYCMGWFIVVGVVLVAAVWKEFLFRGVYLGGLRTKLPFWAANSLVAVCEALAHQPMQLQDDGTVRFSLPGCAPLFAGALWYGYLYSCCQSLQVTVFAHLFFNATIFALTVMVETAQDP